MNTETILAVVAAILAAGWGLFNNLARRKIEKRLVGERGRQRRGLRGKVDAANARAETALQKYERERRERISRNSKPSN